MISFLFQLQLQQWDLQQVRIRRFMEKLSNSILKFTNLLTKIDQAVLYYSARLIKVHIPLCLGILQNFDKKVDTFMDARIT